MVSPTTHAVLPPMLAPWAETLASLDPALAVALGPMLHTLDEMVGRLDARHGDAGELDGFDGTVSRGDPERLLLSEWALADQVPLEFLRRVAENELSYLRRSYRSTKPRGRVVIVCDVGPEQLGPGRLVQLAALVVLSQRARNAGAESELRLLQSGAVHRGGFAMQISHWLRARTNMRASAGQVASALDDLASQDRVWLLLGDPALTPDGHRRVLSSRISHWDSQGATELAVRVGDSSTRVQLPPTQEAIAALRGEGLLARRADPTFGTVTTTGRGAVFNSADTRLLWRGDHEDEVYSCRVDPGSERPNVKRHGVHGAVLAGAFLGRRLVLAVADGGRIRIRTIGKRLAGVDAIDLLISEINWTNETLGGLVQEPIRPLYLSGGTIELGDDEAWWTLSPEGAWAGGFSHIAPGKALDAPRRAYSSPHHLWVDQRDVGDENVSHLVFGPVEKRGPWHARSADSRIWKVACGKEVFAEIGIPEGDRVLGLMLLPRPSLVTLSSGGILVRHYTREDMYTWTRWSGPGYYDVHPTRPWLVRTTPERITVGDLSTGRTVLDLRVDP